MFVGGFGIHTYLPGDSYLGACLPTVGFTRKCGKDGMSCILTLPSYIYLHGVGIYLEPTCA